MCHTCSSGARVCARISERTIKIQQYIDYYLYQWGVNLPRYVRQLLNRNCSGSFPHPNRWAYRAYTALIAYVVRKAQSQVVALTIFLQETVAGTCSVIGSGDRAQPQTCGYLQPSCIRESRYTSRALCPSLYFAPSDNLRL